MKIYLSQTKKSMLDKIKKITLETDRFFLIEIALSNINNNYLSWFQDSVTRKEITAQYSSNDLTKLRGYVAEKLLCKDCLFFGIFDKSSNEHVGNIKYDPINLINHSAVMGILVGNPLYRGIGLAGEVMHAMEELLKHYLDINKIILGVSLENEIAIKAYQKHGFDLMLAGKTENSTFMEKKI